MINFASLPLLTVQQGLLSLLPESSDNQGLLRKLKWHRFGKEIAQERAQYGTLWNAVSIEEAGEQSLGVEDHNSTRSNNIDGIFELPRIRDAYWEAEQSLYASYSGSRAGLLIVLQSLFGKLQVCSCLYKEANFMSDMKEMMRRYFHLPFATNVQVHVESVWITHFQLDCFLETLESHSFSAGVVSTPIYWIYKQNFNSLLLLLFLTGCYKLSTESQRRFEWKRSSEKTIMISCFTWTNFHIRRQTTSTKELPRFNLFIFEFLDAGVQSFLSCEGPFSCWRFNMEASLQHIFPSHWSETQWEHGTKEARLPSILFCDFSSFRAVVLRSREYTSCLFSPHSGEAMVLTFFPPFFSLLKAWSECHSSVCYLWYNLRGSITFRTKKKKKEKKEKKKRNFQKYNSPCLVFKMFLSDLKISPEGRLTSFGEMWEWSGLFQIVCLQAESELAPMSCTVGAVVPCLSPSPTLSFNQ